jgi:hypothetical protein
MACRRGLALPASVNHVATPLEDQAGLRPPSQMSMRVVLVAPQSVLERPI